jgi:hypothetical protein
MKSLVVHLRNSYPEAQVHAREHEIDVFSSEGELLCAVRNGACAQKELGARDAFSLSPIIKQARVWKIDKSNQIAKDEEAAKRKEACKKFLKAGKAPSIEEHAAAGGQFEADGVTAK